GREHQVHTAVALAATGGVEARGVECRVPFRQVAPEEGLRWRQSWGPTYKAGRYEIQCLAVIFVSRN
ncbi:Maf family protein, partial [Pseudomonas aeruginosa]